MTLAALAAAASAAGCGPTLERFEYRQIHMGVDARIVLCAEDEPAARRAAQSAYARIAQLDDAMSDWRPDSELMRLCARAGEGPVPVFGGYRLAIYPRRGGQWPELATPDDRQWIGRFLGRIHAVGAARRFEHRARLSPQAMGRDAVAFLLEAGTVPEYLEHRYVQVTGELLDIVESRFERAGTLRYLRIHGDCHRNNVLWTDQGPHFVDLDDCMNGPAVQDLWLFLAGSRDEMAAQLGDILEGYGKFADFDYRELRLIEALRALRLIHYTAWITRRWHDPAFPRAFPWLGEARYWEQHVQALLEQRAALDEEPLAIVV